MCCQVDWQGEPQRACPVHCRHFPPFMETGTMPELAAHITPAAPPATTAMQAHLDGLPPVRRPRPQHAERAPGGDRRGAGGEPAAAGDGLGCDAR